MRKDGRYNTGRQAGRQAGRYCVDELVIVIVKSPSKPERVIRGGFLAIAVNAVQDLAKEARDVRVVGVSGSIVPASTPDSPQ